MEKYEEGNNRDEVTTWNGKLQKGISGKLLKTVWQVGLDNVCFALWQDHIFLSKDLNVRELGPS